jgi:hypothetical protein
MYGGYNLTDQGFISFYNNEEPGGFQGTGNQLNKFDIGLNARLAINISENMKLKTSILYGFSNLNTGSEKGAHYFMNQTNPQERELKNRQFLIGLSYRIFQKERRPKTTIETESFPI